MCRHWPFLAVAATAASLSSPAFAQGTGDQAVAESLFEEGTFLLSAGKIGSACAKLEASQARSPAPETLFTLADCYERLGKTASAWVTYRLAADAAANARQPERETAARERAAAVERKLARLVIAVPEDVAALDPEVRRDGVVVPRASWSMALPVDPDTVLVTVQAAGKKPWTKSVQAVASGMATVDVTLEAMQGGAAPAASDAHTGRDQRVAGLVVGGVGVVGLAVGTVFGLIRNARLDEAKSHCPDWPSVCHESVRDPLDSARSAGTIATVAFVVGGAAVAGGAVLWLTAPRQAGVASVGIVPVASGEGGSLVLRGVW